MKHIFLTDEFRKYRNDIYKFSDMVNNYNKIDPELYTKYEVKRGLRDISGKGVLAGLTEVSEIVSHTMQDYTLVPCDGKLYYRGYNINDIVADFTENDKFGFEEVAYLLLFGELPKEEEYINFKRILFDVSRLPGEFIRDSVMNLPGKDMMNMLARCVLTLYTYDEYADDITIPNVIRQSVQLIAQMPLLMTYCYHSYNHIYNRGSLIIREPKKEYSVAGNILHMLRPDGSFTELEAKILDLCMVLHAEHGGGNNSTFTTHVVTSSATDTYSSVTASLGSLKGPRHGGTNIKVAEMFEDIMKQISDWENENEIADYLTKVLNKKAFDKSGLIYGMGHAVYSISDPRAVILKKFVSSLAKEKGMEKEFALYEKVERIAPIVIANERKIYKGVSANIDFYSGLVYSLLNIPKEMFTPLFAVSRMPGWCAHRIEELVNAGKIIRPAYKSVMPRKEYIKMKDR